MIRKDDTHAGLVAGPAVSTGKVSKVWPALHLFWAGPLLASGLFAIPRLFAFTETYIHLALTAFIVLIAAIAVGLYRFQDVDAPKTPTFGTANAITLARGVLICLVTGAIGQFWSASAAWTLVAISTFALILDGIDGWFARRQHTESAFGALFDQETDAAFILVLAILVLDQGKAGPWIILSGLLRYAFVAAGLVIVRLRAPLAASLRRKAVCVVQVASLVVCLAPIVQPPLSTWIAATSLALLVYSFAVDVSALLRAQQS